MMAFLKIRNSIFFSLVIFIIVMLTYCSGSKHGPATLQIYAGLSDTASYAGINSCKECHESIYNTFIETGMGRSFETASRKKSSAKFDRHALVYDKYLDFYYHPFWQNDSLKVREFRLKGRDTVYSHTETINYIVGSGQHTNSHIRSANGYLYQVPVTFYTQKGKWDLAPGFENGNNTRFTRRIGLECMSCHNAYPDFVIGSENKYDSVMNGINCERCHGPGAFHVKMKREGHLIDISKEIDYSIVNPAKLPVNLQFDVCQRCHIQGNAVLNEGKSFYDFRPGMPLSSVMNVFMPVFEGRTSEHIMASHAERLKQSKCYLETVKKCDKNSETQGAGALRPYKNALTCVTCHNPHISVKTTGKETFNQACKNCHQSRKENLCTETARHLSEKQNNCVGCHMPKSGATDIPHVRVTDHRIAIPVSEKEIEGVRKFIGITCINNPDPPETARGKAFIAYFEKFNFDKSVLDSAKKYLKDDNLSQVTANFRSLVHLAFLKNNFRQVVDYVLQVKEPLKFLIKMSFSDEDAWCCYRIGESFAAIQNNEESLKYYRKAIELAPFDLNFQNKYGASLMLNNKAGEAKLTFEFIVRQDPGNYQALSNLGYLYLSLYKDTAMAARLYKNALALNPDYESALLNTAGLYIYRQQFHEAIRLLKQMVKKNPGNQKAKQMLANLNSI